MAAVLQGFWLIAAVVAVGWLLAHTRLFGRTEQQVLARLTFWVARPPCSSSSSPTPTWASSSPASSSRRWPAWW
ncbi:hypothetical protein [Ornithinimicrobium sp. CNJ-824]|uniref:hypothetical protein n=1 Tax=Ornithinimicrobium sp. CNJ-824 TaxID=1904966 RepID=UPI00117F9C7C|nr:hypothetical protein [Ornithinimicrobium sp. CNJ-824]